MNLLFVVLLISISFSQTSNYFPFDWGGQFGYLNNKGKIFWNQDWRSNKLLFDGTWAIYPKTYGKKIEDGFKYIQSELHNNNLKTLPESYFLYKQGDYNLDKFLFGLEYGNENRLIKLNGFKRTFSGNVGQYYNNTFQPNQQSYLVSYESINNDEYTAITIGHFNTFTGLVLLDEKGIIDNKITTGNLTWEQKYNNFTMKFNMDNFLQRYDARHPFSLFKGPRFMTRKQFQSKISYYLNDHYHFSFGQGSNKRNIQLNFKDLIVDWNNLYLSFNSKLIRSKFEIVTEEKKYYYSYKFIIQRELGSFNLNMNHSSEYRPIHPYYILGNVMNSNYDMLKNNKNNNLELNFIGKSNLFSIILSHMKDDENFWKAAFLHPNNNEQTYSSQNQKHQYYFLKINCQIKILYDIKLHLSYIQQNPNNIFSGNRHKEGNFRLEKNISLFKNFLDMRFNGMLNVVSPGDRDFDSNINLIEMVPIYNYNMNSPFYQNVVNNDNFAIFNANIEASVSSFKINYEWKNLNHIIANALGYKDNNNILVHYQTPYLGSNMSLTIEWYFQD